MRQRSNKPVNYKTSQLEHLTVFNMDERPLYGVLYMAPGKTKANVSNSTPKGQQK